MKKFVFVYYGTRKMDDVSEEEKKEVMDNWGKWYESIGDKMVDGGNPFGLNSMSVEADKVGEIPADMWPAKGYTIINAESMEAAVEVAKGCPVLKDDPDGSVRVYEAMPM